MASNRAMYKMQENTKKGKENKYQRLSKKELNIYKLLNYGEENGYLQSRILKDNK